MKTTALKEHPMKKVTARQNLILGIVRKHGPIDLDGIVVRANLCRFDVVQAVCDLVDKGRLLVDNDGLLYRIDPAGGGAQPAARGARLEELLTCEECEAPDAAD